MNQKKFIGVFDSGLGGISVLAEMVRLMPHWDFEYLGDSGNAPYGTKDQDFVIARAEEICGDFIARGAEAVVIACNTATSAAASTLRARYSIPIIGMEPAVKPAVEMLRRYENESFDGCEGESEAGTRRKNRLIAVLATPMTLQKEKYHRLVSVLGAEDKVVGIEAPELVELVEQHLFDEERVRMTLSAFIRSRIQSLENLAVVVLGCTHFVFLRHYFEELFEEFGIDAEIVDGNLGTARRLKSLVEGSESASDASDKILRGSILVKNTAGEEMTELSKKLLRYELSKDDYVFVDNAVRNFVDERTGEEGEFVRLYYLERMSPQDIQKEMGLSKKKCAQLLEKMQSMLFKYLKNL